MAGVPQHLVEEIRKNMAEKAHPIPGPFATGMKYIEGITKPALRDAITKNFPFVCMCSYSYWRTISDHDYTIVSFQLMSGSN